MTQIKRIYLFIQSLIFYVWNVLTLGATHASPLHLYK